MRTDYPICPKCSNGRLVPLMFGPGRCDLACENKPVAAREQTAQAQSKTTKIDGILRVQRATRKGVQHSRYVFEPRPSWQIRGRNLRGQRVTVAVGGRHCQECACMQVLSSGSAVVVLDPSDDAKLLWHPTSTITATLEIVALP